MSTKAKITMTVQEAKEYLSEQIRVVSTNGFGYLTPVLRLGMFNIISDADWKKYIIPEILRQNPDLKAKYNK